MTRHFNQGSLKKEVEKLPKELAEGAAGEIVTAYTALEEALDKNISQSPLAPMLRRRLVENLRMTLEVLEHTKIKQKE